MTKEEYITKATAHADKLRSLIAAFHPATADGPRKSIGPITAGGAEAACEIVREQIASEESSKGNPVHRFNQALLSGDAIEVDSLLNSAWFGVPESISCWNIEGFREAVNLMDDPPEPSDEDMARFAAETN